MSTKKLYSLDKLVQYVGDSPEQIKEMIKLFLDTIPPDIELMQEYTEKEEWFEVYKLAHRIKPSFEVFAMDDILHDIIKIEHLANENNVDKGLVEYLHRFSENFKKVTKQLKQEL